MGVQYRSSWKQQKMLVLFVATLALVSAAQACNDVDDPIKRDEGAGPWNVSRVQRLNNGRNGKLVPVDLNNHPFKNSFYEDDSYVLQYSVRAGRKPDVIYYWQGSGSSTWEKGASAILTVQLDNDNGGVAKQARVVMGKEPAHFLKMFQGAFVTLRGGVDRETVVQDTDGTMLFQVKSECNDKGDRLPLTKTKQMEERADMVTSEDVFVLKTPSNLYIYHGQNSSPEERDTAEKVARSLFPTVTSEILTGAAPPPKFVSALN